MVGDMLQKMVWRGLGGEVGEIYGRGVRVSYSLGGRRGKGHN